jgi:hypothetical protein
MTVKSRMLSDRQKAVIETMRLHLNEKQSLAYLKEIGFDISPKTYYNDKRKVESLKLKRLYHIANIGFEDQHLETIDELEMSFKMLWTNVLRERDPYKQNQMIKDIIILKPYLSAYYEATKLIIDKQQSEYKEFLDKHQQQQPEKQEVFESIQRQLNEKDSINYHDIGESFKEYNPNRKF